VCVWITVDPQQIAAGETENITFTVVPTGTILDKDPGRYISTVQFVEDGLIFHIFYTGILTYGT